MTGEPLFDYDLELCEYALGNFRQHLIGLTARPSVAPAGRYADWTRLTFPDWLAGRFADHLPALGDHVWAGAVSDDAPRLPLNDDELFALADAAADLPPRLDAACPWEPYPALHGRAVFCVPDVRDRLTRQTAEDWAAASAGFADRLSRPRVRLADGIGVVHEWVRHARRLRAAMGLTSSLPSPLGTHPTPTRPTPPTTGPGPTADGRPAASRSRRPGGTPEGVRSPRPDGTPGPAGPRLLTPGQVAAAFPVGRSTVYAACRAGRLTHLRVPATTGAKGKYLIREPDLLAWFESLRVGPANPTPSHSAPASSVSPAGPFSELDPSRLSRAWARTPR